MLNTYFRIGDEPCRVTSYDRDTGLWYYEGVYAPFLHGYVCEKFIREFEICA